jgi:hypothetical protein
VLTRNRLSQIRSGPIPSFQQRGAAGRDPAFPASVPSLPTLVTALCTRTSSGCTLHLPCNGKSALLSVLRKALPGSKSVSEVPRGHPHGWPLGCS